jgi:hypothetical protein
VEPARTVTDPPAPTVPDTKQAGKRTRKPAGTSHGMNREGGTWQVMHMNDPAHATPSQTYTPVPTLTRMLPAVPDRATPVAMVMAPDAPELVVPLLNSCPHNTRRCHSENPRTQFTRPAQCTRGGDGRSDDAPRKSMRELMKSKQLCGWGGWVGGWKWGTCQTA